MVPVPLSPTLKTGQREHQWYLWVGLAAAAAAPCHCMNYYRFVVRYCVPVWPHKGLDGEELVIRLRHGRLGWRNYLQYNGLDCVCACNGSDICRVYQLLCGGTVCELCSVTGTPFHAHRGDGGCNIWVPNLVTRAQRLSCTVGWLHSNWFEGGAGLQSGVALVCFLAALCSEVQYTMNHTISCTQAEPAAALCACVLQYLAWLVGLY